MSRLSARFSGLFVRMMASFLCIMLLSFFLFGILSSALFRSNLRGDLRDAMVHMQRRVVEAIRKGHELGWSRETLAASLELFGPPRETVHLLYDGRGKLLYRIGHPERNAGGGTVDADVVARALAGEQVRLETETEDGKLLVLASPIDVPGAQERVVVTQFFGFERNFHLFLHPNLLSWILTIPVACIVFYFFSSRLTRRIREMNRAALNFARGDFRERLRVTDNDEIGQLGRTLNYMADELSSLERVRREFIANVSHDMRAPITSINGFVTALLDGAIPPEKERQYLKLVKDSAERMMKLVEDLLDIARIEAGQFTIEPVRFNLSERIRQTIARMEPVFRQCRIGIHMEDAEEDVRVFADPNRIDQVMVNLLQNAVHHSPPGTEVSVSIRPSQGAVTVEVRDTGSGMTEEELARIWDRFYKGDKARFKKTGTGIGLSIVKHILDLHHSKVEVDSAPGRGTAFRFTLPV